MHEVITLGDIDIHVTRKAIKNVHLSVHPPKGHVTLTAPLNTRIDVARAYAITRLDWIRKRQAQLHEQAREAPRRYVTRESHYLWGKRYLLRVKHLDAKPTVSLDHKHITLYVRPDATQEKREEILLAWQRGLLREALPPMIATWEKVLDVRVKKFYVQRMRTLWGSSNPQSRNIRLNSELIKKPKDLLEYVVVHEMIHFLEPTHNDRFLSLMDAYYPRWREARSELNELPLSNA